MYCALVALKYISLKSFDFFEVHPSFPLELEIDYSFLEVKTGEVEILADSDSRCTIIV